ncbi:MAG: hypothetical protein JNM62_09395 [Flavobacteriales bacterium]|nr:hypothetical protein [Flavobacteriales bacterium]
MGVAAVEGNSGLSYYAPDGSTGDFGHFSDQVYRVRSIDDTLYAAGYFAEVDGQAASGIAKRVDGHWVPVGTMPDPYPLMGDVIRYQGDLISVGQGHSENGGRCIYRLEGDEWHVLAGGITDQLSSASGLVEFQGDLYISGYFSTGTGSAGCGVMRWDGTAYHDVGGGLLRAPFDHDGPTSITSMEVHNGLLYCTGAFQYAGDDTPASGLAIWDGARWCGANGLLADLEDHPQNSVTDLAFLGDTLFVSCGPRIDGEEVGNAARAPMSEVMGACDDTGLLEPTPELPLTLVSNPAEELVTVLSMPPGARAWVVRDALGRTVFTGQVVGTSFPVVHLVPGAYSLSVLGQGGNTLACGRFVRR